MACVRVAGRYCGTKANAERTTHAISFRSLRLCGRLFGKPPLSQGAVPLTREYFQSLYYYLLVPFDESFLTESHLRTKIYLL